MVPISGSVTNILLNDSGVEGIAANRVLTGTGGDVALTNQPTFVQLLYDGAAARWRVVSARYSMNSKLMKFLTFDNLFKVGTLAGLCAILYLNAHYVTRETFDAHNTQQNKFQDEITKTTSGIATSIALLQQNATMLADHEQRLRALERRP